MSQLGMHMPGSVGPRKSGPNVYTGLLFLAVVCLGAACYVVWMNGMKLTPGDGALAPLTELQDPNRIKLK